MKSRVYPCFSSLGLASAVAHVGLAVTGAGGGCAGLQRDFVGGTL